MQSAASLGEQLFLTVLTRSDRERWPSRIPAEAAEGTWQNLQRDLAGLVPNSRHAIVEQSGHFIHIDQPQAVLEAIKEQIRLARK